MRPFHHLLKPTPSCAMQEAEEPACKLLIHFYRRKEGKTAEKEEEEAISLWERSTKKSRTTKIWVPSSLPFSEFVTGLRMVSWVNSCELCKLDSFWGLDASVAVPERKNTLETDVPLTLRTRISPESSQTMGALAAAHGGAMVVVETPGPGLPILPEHAELEHELNLFLQISQKLRENYWFSCQVCLDNTALLCSNVLGALLHLSEQEGASS